MAGSALKRLAVHTSHYSLASLLTTIAGLISFPLLTRVFSVADYGVMSLVGASVTIAVAVGKFGVQHSVLRYHPDVVAGRTPYTLEQLTSTTLFGMVATGAVTALVVVLATRWSPPGVFDRRVESLMAIMSVAIVMQVIGSALVSFSRAEMRTGILVGYQVGKKYLGLGLICVAVFLVARELSALYVATAVAETVAVLGLAAVLFRRGALPRPSWDRFSVPLLKEMLAYGIPMMLGTEVSGIILAVGDRYVIGALIGEEPLGLYAAAYSMCEYVQIVLISSVGLAVMPIYIDMWVKQGREATVRFIDDSLRSYVVLGAPVIAGVAAVGPDLLPALASERYAAATGVVPWIIAGMVTNGANAMMGAGLFIERRSRRIMAVIMAGAALNIGLNFALVPRLGINGSAISTLVSYTATCVGLALGGRQLLKVTLPWPTLGRAAVASALMYLAVVAVHSGYGRLATVGLRAVIGAALYGALMWLIDADARAVLRKLVERFVRR